MVRLLAQFFFGLNIAAALLLLVCFFLPFMPPSEFAQLTLLSLGVMPLIIINTLFAVFWMVNWDKRFVLSAVLVLLSLWHFEGLYQFGSSELVPQERTGLKIMSYNVHLFSAYDHEPNPEIVARDIKSLLAKTEPDVLCLQEYYLNHGADFSAYPYRHIYFKAPNKVLGHAIFSKYPIGETGSLEFRNTANNTIYADVIFGSDTLRIYNVHMQSIGVVPQRSWELQGGAEGISARMENAFAQQEEQVHALKEHRAASARPFVVAGDFNNTVFSHTYQQLKEGLNDAFYERGSGLGATYEFNGYPMRIDYILTDPKWEVTSFETMEQSFSDHRAIMAKISPVAKHTASQAPGAQGKTGSQDLN
ncbi:MAG: endonuclease/exonuclease/phosphatase family protein [Flavobacteriaceae bacterium]|jgi:vancomycin resistance protein VanJ|nr:endonuclease/exonuclease/phosphatase family protein [Flavobacteriaceae bacterium]MDG1962103.1 endonuclease/exonuclease/phosphatase family protein [Flavobacteriaceae bacterium]